MSPPIASLKLSKKQPYFECSLRIEIGSLSPSAIPMRMFKLRCFDLPSLILRSDPPPVPSQVHSDCTPDCTRLSALVIWQSDTVAGVTPLNPHFHNGFMRDLIWSPFGECHQYNVQVPTTIKVHVVVLKYFFGYRYCIKQNTKQWSDPNIMQRTSQRNT